MKTPDRIFLHKDIKTFIADMIWATEKADEWFVHEYISVDAIREKYRELKDQDSEIAIQFILGFTEMLNIDLNENEEE